MLQLVLMLVLFTSCFDQRKISDITPGKTSLKEVLTLYKDPLRIEQVSEEGEVEVFLWKDFSVQVSQKKITHVFRSPAGDEEHLQYWLHQFSEHDMNVKTLASDYGDHFVEMQFSNVGMNIIFDKTQQRVIRIITYEAK